MVLIVLCLTVDFLCRLHLMCVFVWVAEWLPNGKKAAYSAYDMLSLYMYLIANLVFPSSVFGVGLSL